MNSIRSEWITIDQYLAELVNLDTDQLTIYHQRPWLEAVAQGFGCTIKYVRSFDPDGTVALSPYMNMQKGPFSLLGSPLSGMYTEFSGPLFSEKANMATRLSVVRSQHNYISVGQQYVELGVKGLCNADNHWGLELEKLNYSFISRPSLLIDLALGEEVVWSGFKSRARNMIRKAEKADLVAHTITPTQDWIEEYYGLLKETFERQGLSAPHPLSFYRQIETLAEQGLAICVDVRTEAKIAAGAIFLVDGRRMMYFSGVATKDGMRLAAPSLIQWHAMQQAIANNILDYDMGGLGVESIDKFKRSFGGSEIHHSRWVYSSKIFKLVEPVGRWLARKGFIRVGGS